MNEAANPGTMEAALLDLALLSTCDDMVVTVASSFGWVAGTQTNVSIYQCTLPLSSQTSNKPMHVLPELPWSQYLRRYMTQ